MVPFVGLLVRINRIDKETQDKKKKQREIK